jgi:hypothetical protein
MMKIGKVYIQIFICLVIAFFIWNSINTIRFPYSAGYGEAPLMDQARRIENREVIYKSNLNQPPYVISNYPPLYPFFVALTNSMFNIPLFQSGRIISMIFCVISGCIIGLLTMGLTGNKWIGGLSGVLFLGQPFVIHWASLARVDMMALGFSLLGLWVLYRYHDTMPWMVLAGFFFILSVFTRQTYLLSGPLAGFIWLWHLNRKRAILFISIFGVISILIFGMINALTDGGFYTNIVTANINRFDIPNALSLIGQLVFIWPVILITSGMIVIVAIYSRLKARTENQTETLSQPFVWTGLIFYTAGALISAATVVKIGSDENYFLELIAVCAIWIGLTIKVISDQKTRLRPIFMGLLFLQLIWIFTSNLMYARLTTLNYWSDIKTYDSINLQVQSVAKEGNILSDVVMDMIVLAGQRIYYQPLEYCELYYAGLWDPAQFINQVAKKDFPLIIIQQRAPSKECYWPPPVMTAIEANYFSETSGNVLIFTPKK